MAVKIVLKDLMAMADEKVYPVEFPVYEVKDNVFLRRLENVEGQIVFYYDLSDNSNITITKEGVFRAIFMIARIMMLVTGTFLLTYTTSPIALTDGLESLLSPLKVFRFPVHEISMMMCIALRFIPTLIEETDKIMSAQKARGADFETGGLIQRVKALVPILIPLFISAFRRADELATAMECRCYHGGEGRTKMKLLRYKRRDFGAYGIGILLLAGIITLAVFGL